VIIEIKLDHPTENAKWTETARDEAEKKMMDVEVKVGTHRCGAHDQADAEWIVIRRPLWDHNDTPFGRPVPGRPSRAGRGLAALRAYFVCFSYYLLVMLFIDMVCLIVGRTHSDRKRVDFWHGFFKDSLKCYW
jgi:hypothetical protein